MRRLLLLFTAFVLCAGQIAAQRTVTGTVRSSADNLTLPGVSILQNGTTNGTITDNSGRFSLRVPSGDVTLLISTIGFTKQEVLVKAGISDIDVVLQISSSDLDEVVVVAYGTAKKGTFTGSAVQISSDKITARPISNITRAIEGAAPGVQVTSGSGQPGSAQSIRIRGFGSYSASNDPLYIVDGVPFSGNLSNLNPDDIETLSILKDAGSTALYGNKAANGVVVIKTKRGIVGKSQFQVKFAQGYSSRAIPEYDRVGALEYYPLMWEAYRNQLYYVSSNPPTLDVANQTASGLVAGKNGIKDMLGYNIFNVANNALVGTDGKMNSDAAVLKGYQGDLDWYKPIRRIGKRTDLNLSGGGGTEKNTYYASLGYTNEEGYMIKSDLQRITARVNVNIQPKKWFRTGVNISGTSSKSNEANTGSSTGYVNPFFFARNMGPLYPVYAHNATTGDYLLDQNGQKIYDLGNMSQFGLPARPAGASVGRHVVEETLLNLNKAERTMLDGKTFFDIMFLDGFKFSANLGMNLYSYRFNRFDNKIVGDGSPAGRGGKESDLTTDITLNQLLTYERAFGDHAFDVLVGHESYQDEYKYLYGFKQGLVVDGNVELINFTTINDLTSYVSNYNSEGYLSRLNYSYKNKYFGSASYRRDGSSKFFKDVRWGNFWSVGGAWRIDQESFIKGLPWINMLKLRSSYGEVGNDAGIGTYAWQALYGLDYNNALEAGALQSSLASKELVWEKNANYDAALEFGLFNRFRGTIEYFHRQSSNLLFSVPKPLSSGILSRSENVGTMYNRGLELDLTVDVVNKGDFRWTVNGSLTTFKNEFTKLPQKEIIDGTKKLMVGHSIYDYWLREWMGVDKADGRALYRASSTSYATDKAAFDANPASTGIKDYRIVQKDTMTINSNKAAYHYNGSAIPDFFGSLTNTFRYRNFDLSFMLTYQVGGKVYDGTYAGLMDPGSYGSAVHTDILQRWQKDGDVTNVPRMDGNTTIRGYSNAASDRWLTDASYLNFRSVSIGYTIPSSLMKKIDLSECKIYASGENLMLFTARKGMGVQQQFNGVTYNDYIPSRVITVGLNITF